MEMSWIGNKKAKSRTLNLDPTCWRSEYRYIQATRQAEGGGGNGRYQVQDSGSRSRLMYSSQVVGSGESMAKVGDRTWSRLADFSIWVKRGQKRESRQLAIFNICWNHTVNVCHVSRQYGMDKMAGKKAESKLQQRE